MSQFLIAALVPADAVVGVSVVVSSVRDPFPFFVAVAVLIAGVFLNVVVIVPGVVSFSGLLFAITWAIAVLIPTELFHIDTVIFFIFCCGAWILLIEVVVMIYMGRRICC